jgi:hypothetical protein
MHEGLSLGSYLLLVDYIGRLFRYGKAVISANLMRILKRLGTTAETWQARLERLKAGRLLGRFFAASRDRLREVSGRLKVHRLANLAGLRGAINRFAAQPAFCTRTVQERPEGLRGRTMATLFFCFSERDFCSLTSSFDSFSTEIPAVVETIRRFPHIYLVEGRLND